MLYCNNLVQKRPESNTSNVAPDLLAKPTLLWIGFWFRLYLGCVFCSGHVISILGWPIPMVQVCRTNEKWNGKKVWSHSVALGCWVLNQLRKVLFSIGPSISFFLKSPIVICWVTLVNVPTIILYGVDVEYFRSRRCRFYVWYLLYYHKTSWEKNALLHKTREAKAN